MPDDQPAPAVGSPALQESGPAERDHELRLALVLNGGVSLAVWMSGVIHELDAARCAPALLAGAGGDPSALAPDDRTAGVYDSLLGVIATRLVIDVIAGTSAGGLNGALIGTAIAKGTRLRRARETWLELGSFADLLRNPRDAEPPSLLKGDEYFLPQIRAVLAARFDEPALAGLDGARLRLILTGTDLYGTRVNFTDSYSRRFADTEHRVLFRFACPTTGNPVQDPDPTDDRWMPLAPSRVDQLARAARTTASFPVAFEPSVIDLTAVSEPPLAPTPALPRSEERASGRRQMMDGGVLANSPFAPVLQEIAASPAAEGAIIRRALVFVVPYAGAVADVEELPPTLRQVLSAASGLARELAQTEGLLDARDHVQRMLERAETDTALLGLSPAVLRSTAYALKGAYRERRRGAVDEWLGVRLMRNGIARELVGPLRVLLDSSWLPWVADPATTAASEAVWDAELAGALSGSTQWEWGQEPVVSSARRVLAAIRSVRRLLPHSPEMTEPRNRLHQAQLSVQTALASVADGYSQMLTQQVSGIRAVRDGLVPAGDGDQLLAALRAALILPWRPDAEFPEVAPGALAELIAAQGLPAEPELPERLRAALATISEAWLTGLSILELPAVAPLEAVRVALNGSASDWQGMSVATAAQRLLQIEVIARSMAPKSELPPVHLEWMRLNAEAPAPFGALPRPLERAFRPAPGAPDPDAVEGRIARPEEKLRGMELGHFGGFLLGAWRANDFLWGRLDGAARIVDLLLTPDQLRELARSDAELADALLAIAIPETVDAAGAALLAASAQTRDELRAIVVSEVTEARSGAASPGAELPWTRRLLRDRLQLEVLQRELPIVSREGATDEDQGGRPHPAEWRRIAATAGPDGLLAPADAVRAYNAYDVPAQSVSDEAGSDLVIRMAMQAVAVAGAAASGSRSGLPGVVRGAVASARGTLMALWFLVDALTNSSKAARRLIPVLTIAAVAYLGWRAYNVSQHPEQTGSPPFGNVLALSALLMLVLAFVLGWTRRSRTLVAVASIGAATALLVVFAWNGGGGHATTEINTVARAIDRAPLGTVIVGLLAFGFVLGVAATRAPLPPRAATGRRVGWAVGRVITVLLLEIGTAAVLIGAPYSDQKLHLDGLRDYWPLALTGMVIAALGAAADALPFSRAKRAAVRWALALAGIAVIGLALFSAKLF